MSKTKYYIKLVFSFFAYAVVGAIIAAVISYILGAVIGLAATFYNNHFLMEAAQGSYLWWANFFGYILVCFSVLPGAGIGFVFRLIKLTEK